MFFMFSAMLGFGQGFQPVAGFNYGAKKYGRVHEATRFTILVGTVVMAVFSLVIFIFFSSDIDGFPQG